MSKNYVWNSEKGRFELVDVFEGFVQESERLFGQDADQLRAQLTNGGSDKPEEPMRKWKVLARHRDWVTGATITESVDDNSDDGYRRFTATIRGWRNFRIWQGPTAYQDMAPRIVQIVNTVRRIRDRIDANDLAVFSEKGAW